MKAFLNDKPVLDFLKVIPVKIADIIEEMEDRLESFDNSQARLQRNPTGDDLSNNPGCAGNH
jgi:hypothetical protein